MGLRLCGYLPPRYRPSVGMPLAIFSILQAPFQQSLAVIGSGSFCIDRKHKLKDAMERVAGS